MSMMDELLAQVMPAIEAFRADPSCNPNLTVMTRLVDRISDMETSPFSVTRPVAAEMVMGMTINISDPADIDKAVDFLMAGYEMVAISTKAMIGFLDTSAEPVVIAGCRTLSVEC